MKKVYKYRGGIGINDLNNNSIFERDVHTLVDNKIYAPTIKELNDPSENSVNDELILNFYKNISKIDSLYDDLVKMKDMFSNMGIYSLSKDYNSHLLWAYYASGHTGFVIEYDLDLLYNSFQYIDWNTMCYLVEVNYSNKVPKIKNPLHLRRITKNMDILPLYLGNKSKYWRHENELRLVLEKRGLIEYDYQAVTAIYFGCKMEKSEMNYIMSKLKGRDIRYYKMKLEKNYELTAVGIKNKYYNANPYIVNSVIYNEYFLSQEYLKNFYNNKNQVREALQIISKKPLVKDIIGLKLSNEDKNITIHVMTTVSGIYPMKVFSFILDDNNKLLFTEDIRRNKYLLEEYIEELKNEA